MLDHASLGPEGEAGRAAVKWDDLYASSYRMLSEVGGKRGIEG